MNRLRRKILIPLILLTLVATLTAGGFSLVYIQDRIRSNTFEYLTESAHAYGHELNTVIGRIEGTTETLTLAVKGIIDPTRLDDPEYFKVLSDQLEPIAAQFDQGGLNVMSVYVRFDPAISYGTAGFFHADVDGDGRLEQQIPTDLTQYDPSDREHVGWFYEPLQAGSAIWMNPYYNANIDIDMVSYITPLTVDGTAIGVVGVDVNFAQLTDIVQASRRTGKAFLFDDTYRFLVHDTFKPSDTLSSIDDGKLAGLQRIMESKDDGAESYELFGVKKVLGFSRLSNGWTVAVAMTTEEAFAGLNSTITMLKVMDLIVAIVMIALALLVGRYLDSIVLRNSELEEMVKARTQELFQTNEYLEESLAELENKQAELILLNDELEDSLFKLNETQEQLITSEKLASLGELVAGVAHEINTPLGIAITLNTFAEKNLEDLHELTNSDEPIADEMESCLQASIEASGMVTKNLKKAAEIVDTFKQVAIDQSGLDMRRINLSEYINKVVMNLTSKLKDSDHKVKITCDPYIEILTYPGAISLIITHLIMNSITHGFQGMKSRHINIEASVPSDDSKVPKILTLTYTDDGIGIPPEYLDKVFNPFFSTKKNKGSTGMGLHIVHNAITQTLKGTITLKSRQGEGVEITIAFPEIYG